MLEYTSTEYPPQTGIPGIALNLGRGLFLGSLLAVPWMIGGVPYWAALITAVLFLLLSLLTGLASFFKQSDNSISKVSILLGILVVYPALQLLPLSSHPIERLEQVIDAELVEAAQLAVQSEGNRFAVSSVPYKTRHTLAMYATGFAVFLFSGVLWNTPGKLRFLFLALTANGVVLSLFGMIQKFRWDGAIYGIYQLEHGGQPFASFVNRNNASAYLLVCLAAGVGLLMSCLSSREEQGYHHQADRSGENRLLIGVSLVLIAAGIVASLSRSGILSATIASVVVLAMAFRSGKTLLVAIGFLAGLSALAVWFGWGSDLFTRFALLRDMNIEEIGRIQHWKSTWPAIQDFGLFGSGLGTYSMVNRPYQPHENYGWFVNADNQYVEWALELGIIGFSLVMLIVICLFLMTGKLLNSSRKLAGFRYSLGITALFLLTSQLVHALFDFGITRPATHLSIAAVLGAISAYFVRNSGDGIGYQTAGISNRFQLKWNPLLAFGCIVIMASVVAVTGSAYPNEKLARQVTKSLREIPNTSIEQLHKLRKKLLIQAQKNPESPVIFESLTQIDQALMRLEFLKTQGASETMEIGRYWDSSSPARLALTVLGRDSLTETLHRLWKKKRLALASREYELSLLHSLRVNPLNGYAWRELGILNWMRQRNQDEVLRQLECAAMLRPSELDIQMICAIELASSGEEQTATRLFRDLMSRFPSDANRLWEAARRCYSIETVVQKILPEEISVWEGIWEAVLAQQENKEAQLQLAKSISARLEADPSEKKVPAGLFMLAVTNDFKGNRDKALELISKAIRQKPLEANWRGEYARMLIHAGQVDAARKQLETAYRISPNDRKIKSAYKHVLSLRSNESKQ